MVSSSQPTQVSNINLVGTGSACPPMQASLLESPFALVLAVARATVPFRYARRLKGSICRQTAMSTLRKACAERTSGPYYYAAPLASINSTQSGIHTIAPRSAAFTLECHVGITGSVHACRRSGVWFGAKSTMKRAWGDCAFAAVSACSGACAYASETEKKRKMALPHNSCTES